MDNIDYFSKYAFNINMQAEGLDINVINFVRTCYPDNLHFHPTRYEFHFCVEGETKFYWEKLKIPFTPGVLTFVWPEQQHQLMMDRVHPVSFYYLIFNFHEELAGLRDRLIEKFKLVKYVRLDRNYKNFFEDLRQRLQTDDEYSLATARSQLLSFMQDLIGDRISDRRDKTAQLINQAIEIMQNSLHRQLGLEELAAKVDRNKSYFSRLFKARMKMSPIKYFSKLKIEAACRMLKQNELSIATIAERLAFYDEFHFSHVFKQFTGTSPGKYRKTVLAAPQRHAPE